MKTIRVQLTPAGHYFLGGERGFGYDPTLKRQLSASYFIRSLKVPAQTTLFGTLRYIIGVKDGKLREDAAKLIGSKSFDIVDDNSNYYGIIKNISPVYLHKCNSSRSSLETSAQPDGYYIRTPFDHNIAERKGEHKVVHDKYYPMLFDENKKIKTINFPDDKVVEKCHPCEYDAKEGISKSYTCISSSEHKIVKESDIFTSSVEVVSRKAKKRDSDQDGFAKKEYFRLNPGWSFVFFAELDGDKDLERNLEYNHSAVLGKDSSVFLVDVSEENEPDVIDLFTGRGKDFHYFQSPSYITCSTSELIGNAAFSILESETLRRFKTEGHRLMPEYRAPLIQLISAGSIIYSTDISKLINEHAAIAGFNRIVNGG